MTFFQGQDNDFPLFRFMYSTVDSTSIPNFFDIQKASVSTNPPKSGGGDVVEDLRKGLPAQGETGFFETSSSSLAGSK